MGTMNRGRMLGSSTLSSSVSTTIPETNASNKHLDAGLVTAERVFNSAWWSGHEARRARSR